MTLERLKEIRERAEKATRGPWRVDTWPCGSKGSPPLAQTWASDVRAKSGEILCFQDTDWTKPPDHPDAAFIAHARSDVPDLLEEVERLRAALEKQRRDMQRRIDFCCGPSEELCESYGCWTLRRYVELTDKALRGEV